MRRVWQWWDAGALRSDRQIARATRGRDLHLNVPFPREPPDLLMAESPLTGGLSALNSPAIAPLVATHGSTLMRGASVEAVQTLQSRVRRVCRRRVSREDVAQCRLELLARVLKFALDVQACRAAVGP